MELELVDVDRLSEHEEIDKDNLERVKETITKKGYFKEPIVVDKENMVVLDGHHRLNMCRQLGLKKIPCMLVDYLKDKKIRVESRREGFTITKEAVVEKAKSQTLFPNKTTRHFIPQRIKKMRILLEDLA
jgi:ParB-like chromosome segregation protein Spo0J